MTTLQGSFRSLFRILRGEAPWPPLRRRKHHRPKPKHAAGTAEPAQLAELPLTAESGEARDSLAPEVRDIEDDAPERTISSPTADLSRTHADAEISISRVAPMVETFAAPMSTPASVPEQVSQTLSHGVGIPADGPVLVRDRDIVLAVIRHRFLSFQQLRTLLFPDVHRSVVGRRLQALTDAEWLKVWEDRVERGGHPRYALPTKKGLLWARRMLLATSSNAVHARLVATMLRDRSPTPITFKTYPNYLAHQRELNDLLLALARANLDLPWVSSWHRPFPNTAEGRPLPQPDAVLVLQERAAPPRLLFLEHDRDTEATSSFQADKAARYAAFAHARASLAALTGFSSFEVLVTVHAADALTRIAALQETVRTTMGAATLFRFTPDAWLLDAPMAAIWFAARTPVNRAAASFREQAGLITLSGSTGAAAGRRDTVA